MMIAADLTAIKSEPDLGKRSDLALANADRDIDSARDAYKAGDMNKVRELMAEIRESVNLAVKSLEESKQQARRSKYYKRAELKTRALARRLTTLADEVSVDDRHAVEEVRAKVQELHDHLLEEIMSNKK
jgi:hypothetical protein